MSEKSKSPPIDDPDKVSDDSAALSTQDRFEERCDLYMNQFRTLCEENDVKVAIAIVIDPVLGVETPIVWARGHVYEQAKILALCLRNMKGRMAEELDA